MVIVNFKIATVGFDMNSLPIIFSRWRELYLGRALLAAFALRRLFLDSVRVFSAVLNLFYVIYNGLLLRQNVGGRSARRHSLQSFFVDLLRLLLLQHFSRLLSFRRQLLNLVHAHHALVEAGPAGERFELHVHLEQLHHFVPLNGLIQLYLAQCHGVVLAAVQALLLKQQKVV